MANKFKKIFIAGTLLSCLFLATTACDFAQTSQNTETSSQQSTDSNISSQPSSEKPVTLESITAVSNKNAYEHNESLDITVTAHYSDGTTTTITDYQVLGFNNQQTGEQNVAISYAGQSCVIKVTVKDPVLTGITATSKKDAYEYGEDLDIVVTASYSDGSSKVITDYQVTGYNAQISSEQDVVISYQGQSSTLKVKVNDPILVNITVEGQKENYEYGEDLGLQVKANYSDGSSIAISDYQVEGFDSKNPGEQNVTVKYNEKTYSFKTTVNNPVLTSISVTSNKESYEYGEDLDVVVTASYSDDTTKVITNYEVEGFDSKNPGEQNVTVKYEGKTSSIKVIVNNPVLTGITAVSNKESYEYGDDLDVIVVAHYSDGSDVVINDYQVEGFSTDEAGTKSLTFTYEGKTCNLDVLVNKRETYFPTDKLDSFLQVEGLKTSIPTPIGFNDWIDSVEKEQDGGNYFIATTKDEGTIGVDSLTDQYTAKLENEGWVVVDNNGKCFATTKNGDVSLSFSTNNGTFSLRVEAYCEFPTQKVVGSVISSKSSLVDGQTVVLGSIPEEFVISGFEDTSFSVSEALCTRNEFDVVKNAWRFTINKVDSNWTFTDINGRKLGATGLNQLAWDEGSTEWNLIFTSTSCIIMNAVKEYGRLCYNPDTQMVTTYETIIRTNMSYPQIFNLKETEVIYPTAISIDGRNEAGVGKTINLNLNYVPENSNSLNEVIWSSSDESIATVGSDGNVKGVSQGKVTITAKTKSKNNYLEASYDVEVLEAVPDRWTIMVYVCGADLESDSGLASADISEMLKVSNQPEDVNIILETGGSSRWHKYNISSNVLSRYHIKNKNLVLDETLPKDNMGKQSVFESFLTWGIQQYPAEKTGVVLWNHGGALGGVCFDSTTGYSNSLTNSETASAYKNVFGANSISKLEFVGYDACLMQIQDIAEFNSHYFNYMVGSEESEAGTGWVYNEWIDDVYADRPTTEILKANCDSFVNKNGGDQTLSYLDLSNMNDYYTKFEALASAIKNTAKSNYDAFKSILLSCKSYSGIYSFGEIDGMDFLNKLGNNSTYSGYQNEINEVKAAHGKLVAYSRRGGGAGQSYGLGIIAGAFVSYPASETNFTTWRSIFK